MSKSRISLGERVTAETYGILSHLGRVFTVPAYNIGGKPTDSYRPALWRFARHMRADDIEWPDIAGTSGRIPNKYAGAAVFTFDRAVTDELITDVKGRKAAAYVLKSQAVMVGTTPGRELFGIDMTDTSRYQLAMRLGEGALHGQPGLTTPDNRFLSFPPEVDISYVRYERKQDMPTGVRYI